MHLRPACVIAACLTLALAAACDQPPPEPQVDEADRASANGLERVRNARFGFAASYPGAWQLQPAPANGDGFTASGPEGSGLEVRAWGSHHMGSEPQNPDTALSYLMNEQLGFIDGASKADVEPVDVSVQYVSADDTVDVFVEGRVVSYSQEGQDGAEAVSLLLTSHCGTDYFQQVSGLEGSDASVDALALELFGQFRILADESDHDRCPVEGE